MMTCLIEVQLAEILNSVGSSLCFCDNYKR